MRSKVVEDELDVFFERIGLNFPTTTDEKRTGEGLLALTIELR